VKWSCELGIKAAEDSRLVDDRGRVCCSDRNLQGAIWLKGFLKELEKKQEIPSLHIDNQSAIDLANNLVYHNRTKHIDVRYHFIRKMLKALLKIHMSQNSVDMLTKVVTVEKLKSCSASVGLQT